MRRWLAGAGLVGVLLAASGGVAEAATHHKPKVIKLPMTYVASGVRPVWQGEKGATIQRGNGSLGLDLWPPQTPGGTLWQAQLVAGAGGKSSKAARRNLLTIERETAMDLTTEGGATYQPVRPVGRCNGRPQGGNVHLSRRWWLGFYCIPFRLPAGASVATVAWGPYGKNSSVVAAWYRAG